MKTHTKPDSWSWRKRLVAALFVATLILPFVPLALLEAAPSGPIWTCSIPGKVCVCRTVWVRSDVMMWQRVIVCGPARQSRIAGLAAPVAGNRGGCAATNYYRGVACTVKQAGTGWAFGDCEFGWSFSGPTKLALASGAEVEVSGCKDKTGNLFAAGKKYPLVIKVN